MNFSNIKFFYTFRLPPPVPDLDQPTAEEFIQHYAQNYSSLKKALKFKETFSEVEPKLLHKALRFTSNLPGDLYTPAECVEQVKYFTQQIQKIFNSEYGLDIHNERLEILEFLYLVEKFLANIFQKFFHYDTKSGSESSEENTEDTTQDSK